MHARTERDLETLTLLGSLNLVTQWSLHGSLHPFPRDFQLLQSLRTCTGIQYMRVIALQWLSLISAAPGGIPASISFSDVNLTSITVQWTELPCSDRNGEIAGYTVEYSSSTPPPHTNTINVSGSSNTRLVVGGLLPRTNYIFSVKAQGAPNASSETRFTATPMG